MSSSLAEEEGFFTLCIFLWCVLELRSEQMLPNFSSNQGACPQAYRACVKEKERRWEQKGGDRCL
ncbi:hypothetical protein EV213_10838 [Aureibacillus halotolerans]|uniref:Uncharacterized protein n=1 Tax=Aureibacillus halotolerans TaxID=1508390 RepID=A0A4R6TZM3_9BACI|nr:hypothetical protein EV213_10838 [Aureibacillus halotolerans]